MKKTALKFLNFALVLSMVLSTVAIVPMTAGAEGTVDYSTTPYASLVDISNSKIGSGMASGGLKADKLFITDNSGASSKTPHNNVKAASLNSMTDALDAAKTADGKGNNVLLAGGKFYQADGLLPTLEQGSNSNYKDVMRMEPYSATEGTKTFDLSGKYIKGVSLVMVSHSPNNKGAGAIIGYADGSKSSDDNCQSIPTFDVASTTNLLLTGTQAGSSTAFNLNYTDVLADSSKPATLFSVHTSGNTDAAARANYKNINGVGDGDLTVHAFVFADIAAIYEIEYSFNELDAVLNARLAELETEYNTNGLTDNAKTIYYAIVKTVNSAVSRGYTTANLNYGIINTLEADMRAEYYADKPYGAAFDISSLLDKDSINPSGGSNTYNYNTSDVSNIFAADEKEIDGVIYKTQNLIRGYSDTSDDTIRLTGNTVNLGTGKKYTLSAAENKFYKQIGTIWPKGSVESGTDEPANHKGNVVITFNDNTTQTQTRHGYSYYGNKAPDALAAGATNISAGSNVIYISKGDVDVTNGYKSIKGFEFNSHNSGIFSVIGIEYSLNDLKNTVLPAVINDLYSKKDSEDITDSVITLKNTVASANARVGTGYNIISKLSEDLQNKYTEIAPEDMNVTIALKKAMIPVGQTLSADALLEFTGTLPSGYSVKFYENNAEITSLSTVGEHSVKVVLSCAGYMSVTETFTITAIESIADYPFATGFDLSKVIDSDYLAPGASNDATQKPAGTQNYPFDSSVITSLMGTAYKLNNGIYFKTAGLFTGLEKSAKDSIAIVNTYVSNPKAVDLADSDYKFYKGIGAMWYKGSVDATGATHSGTMIAKFADGTTETQKGHGYTNNGTFRADTLGANTTPMFESSSNGNQRGYYTTKIFDTENQGKVLTGLGLSSHNSAVYSIAGIEYPLSEVGAVLKTAIDANYSSITSELNTSNIIYAQAIVNTYDSAAERAEEFFDATQILDSSYMSKLAVIRQKLSTVTKIESVTFPTVTPSKIIAHITTVGTGTLTAKLMAGQSAIANLTVDENSDVVIDASIYGKYNTGDVYLRVSMTGSPYGDYDITVPKPLYFLNYSLMQNGSKVANFADLAEGAYQMIIDIASNLTDKASYAVIGAEYDENQYFVNSSDVKTGTFTESVTRFTFDLVHNAASKVLKTMLWESLDTLKPYIRPLIK